MCMKNVNVNAILADIVVGENGKYSLLNIEKDFRIKTNNNPRIISQLSIAVVVAATQTKDEDIAIQLKSDKVFVFRSDYEVKIRLTETKTGAFKDLGQFELNPSKADVYKGICKHTFNYTHLGIYRDISLPEFNENEQFVIKLLIRPKNETDNNGWIVQSAIPIIIE